ncbi:AzlD domain-containing protein [Fodinicola feengrottensis]|uniref:AzlD domain-containing protein n=1 Tax=Fodinicola feengrottensis TaxID=435914 RepID=UPI002441E917|nr:AzlD domain-containing protein [Fodinicola feengrottensis]
MAQPEPALSRLGFWVTGGAVFVLWNAMTLVGAAGASVLGNPQTFGLDAAAPPARPRPAGAPAASWLDRAADRDRRRAGGPRDHATAPAGRTGPAVRAGHPARTAAPPTREGPDVTLWIAIAVAAVGSYGIKLLGLLLPGVPRVNEVLERPRIRRAVELLPVALLAALMAVEAFATGQRLVIDARTAGLAAAVIALLLRAPFIVIVVVAAVTAALVRLFF